MGTHVLQYIAPPTPSFKMNPCRQYSNNLLPKTPPRVVYRIIDALKHDIPSLKQCSLVAKTWHSRSRQWLFEAVVIKSWDFRFNIVHAHSPDLLPGASDDKMFDSLSLTHNDG